MTSAINTLGPDLATEADEDFGQWQQSINVLGGLLKDAVGLRNDIDTAKKERAKFEAETRLSEEINHKNAEGREAQFLLLIEQDKDWQTGGFTETALREMQAELAQVMADIEMCREQISFYKHRVEWRTAVAS